MDYRQQKDAMKTAQTPELFTVAPMTPVILHPFVLPGGGMFQLSGFSDASMGLFNSYQYPKSELMYP